MHTYSCCVRNILKAPKETLYFLVVHMAIRRRFKCIIKCFTCLEFFQLTKSISGGQAGVDNPVVLADDTNHAELPVEMGCFGGPENSHS